MTSRWEGEARGEEQRRRGSPHFGAKSEEDTLGGRKPTPKPSLRRRLPSFAGKALLVRWRAPAKVGLRREGCLLR